MKKLFALVLMLLVSAISVEAQETEVSPPLDVEQMGAEYLAVGVLDIVQYEGGYVCKLEKQGAPKLEERSDFRIDKVSGKIIYQMVNGIVVCDVSKGDQPLDGFMAPMGPTNGYVRTNFYCWVSGLNKAKDSIVYGSTQTIPYLAAGAPIIIELWPREQMRRFTPQELGVPAGLTVKMPEGSGSGYYDEYTGTYIFWVAPFWTDPAGVPFELVDPVTGTVYRSGRIQFLLPTNPSLSTSSAVGFNLRPGVVVAQFNKNSDTYLNSQRLQGLTKRDGAWISAQSYLLDAKEKALIVNGRGNTDFVVRVRAEDGTIVDRVWADSNGYFSLRIIPGFGQLRVTVSGTPRADNPTFWINMHLRDQLPDESDDGGKG